MYYPTVRPTANLHGGHLLPTEVISQGGKGVAKPMYPNLRDTRSFASAIDLEIQRMRAAGIYPRLIRVNTLQELQKARDHNGNVALGGRSCSAP